MSLLVCELCALFLILSSGVVFTNKQFLFRTDDYNKRRLLAKAFAALEESYTYQKSLLADASDRCSTIRQRSVLTVWHNFTMNRIADRNAIEEKAKRNGRRLTLLIGFQCWRSSVKIAIKERELNALVEEKWKEVYKWLDTK